MYYQNESNRNKDKSLMFLIDTNASPINNSFFNRIHYLLEVDWILFHNKICSSQIIFMLFQSITADQIDCINTVPKINAAETFFLGQKMAHNLQTTKGRIHQSFQFLKKLTFNVSQTAELCRL
jgi:hypothetical protein